jgi:hypothetical protein
MNANISFQFDHRNVNSKSADLDFESLARNCLLRGALALSGGDIMFIGAAIKQLDWCCLTTEQANRLLDLAIVVREGNQ